MSTPFPLEEQQQEDNAARPSWDPWSGPVKPSFWAGAGFDEDNAYVGPVYQALDAIGSSYAKGAAVLNGIEKSVYGGIGDIADFANIPSKPFRYLEQGAQQNEDTARQTVRDLTPNASTTGTAMQILHGVVGGATELGYGLALGGAPAAATAVGATEGGTRYQELKEAGVDDKTAAASGLLAGATAAAGAVLPAAYGTTLFTRVATGAASNAAFGMIDRYADHKILELGGYPEMAGQQRALDGTQFLVDLALGATFGALHHLSAGEETEVKTLQSPDNRDAAFVANLGLRDRDMAPGVPVDPAAAGAHEEALAKAQEDVLQNRAVDVSDTGVIDQRFLARPERDFSPVEQILLNALKEGGLFEEEAKLSDLQGQLEDLQRQPTREHFSNAPEGTRMTPLGESDEARAELNSSDWDSTAQALAERPDLEMPDDTGTPAKAADLLATARDNSATASKEVPPAITAAATCALRRGFAPSATRSLADRLPEIDSPAGLLLGSAGLGLAAWGAGELESDSK